MEHLGFGFALLAVVAICTGLFPFRIFFYKLNFCRDCVQTFAMASGVEHFKCPNCNNKELIAKVFQKIGIYVPQKVYFWKNW